ncbi:hypothetical protein V6Z11_A10G203400 [Gossypium hirsutum]
MFLTVSSPLNSCFISILPSHFSHLKKALTQPDLSPDLPCFLRLWPVAILPQKTQPRGRVCKCWDFDSYLLDATI